MTQQAGLLVGAITWPDFLLPVAALLVGLVFSSERLLRAVQAVRREWAIRRRVATLARHEAEAEAPVTQQGLELANEAQRALGNLARDPIQGPRIYATAVEMQDFRCFAEMAVGLRHPGDGSGFSTPT